MKTPTKLPIENLKGEPYASVVCYPKSSPTEIHTRIEALKQLGVEVVEFTGRTAAANVPVLGKGYVGVVVVALVHGQRLALKMRRTDADRTSLEHEAELLKKANAVDVGPKFVAVSKDFLLMQLIEGDLLYEWLETHRDKELVRAVVVDVLEQCWRLDEVGLDHGEISKAPKHLLVDQSGKPFIVDFETASLQRHASNVTSVCQFLFQGNSDAAANIAQILGPRNRPELLDALRAYKKNPTRTNFESLLAICTKP